MSVPTRYVRFPHRVVVVQDIPLMNGVTIPKGARGWLVSYSHIWKEPNVIFDGYGWAGIVAECIQAIRIHGRLIRQLPPMDDGDGLLTCSHCGDRYTTNTDGICGECKFQAWLDTHA